MVGPGWTSRSRDEMAIYVGDKVVVGAWTYGSEKGGRKVGFGFAVIYD